MTKSKKTGRRAPLVNRKTVEPAGAPWQLETARARFSEVVRLARATGPQLITPHGKEPVVLLSVEQFHQLVPGPLNPQALSVSLPSPLVGLDLDLKPTRDLGSPRLIHESILAGHQCDSGVP